MVCLGFEPGAAGWQAQTKPRSYGGNPKKEKLTVKVILYEFCKAILFVCRITKNYCNSSNEPFYLFQFGDDFHFDIVSYMLHMHVKSNWQNGVIQMVPPVEVKSAE